MNALKPRLFFINVLQSYQTILAKLETALERDPVLQLVGFPKRIYASREPEFARETYMHPSIGLTKFPQLIPRVVDTFQRSGSLILEGGEVWRARREITQPCFGAQHIDAFLEPVLGVTNKYIAKWRRVEKNRDYDIFGDLKKLIVELNFRMLFSTQLSDEHIEALADATFFLDLRFASMVPLCIPTPDNRKFIRSVKLIHEALEGSVAGRQSFLVQHLREQLPDRKQLLGELRRGYPEAGGRVAPPLRCGAR